MNKKGDTMTLENVIFIILNLIFFVILFAFVVRSSNAEVIYEQTYAKEIALMIDKAEPGMTIMLNMDDAVKISQKNEQSISNMVRFDNGKNTVTIALTKSGGYSMAYYTKCMIESRFVGNNLVIDIKKKVEK